MNKPLITLLFAILLSATVYGSHPSGTVYVDVNGLVCDFCARALEKVFGRQDEVDAINVDLDNKVITIHFEEGQSLDEATISELVADSGYDVRAIRYGS